MLWSRLSALSILCAFVLLAACSKPNESAPTDGSAEESGEAAAQGSESDEGRDEAAEGETKALVVYSGRNEAMVGPLIERFESETGIDVQVNYAGSSQLAATILEEGQASPACVFFGQDSSTLGLLAQEGRLTPLPEEVVAKVPKSYRSGEDLWVGTSGRARALTYNTSAVQADDLPTSLRELTLPAWRGRVGWAPENSSFQSFLAAMVKLEGSDATRAWVDAMLANEPHAYPSNTPGVVAVANGEIDLMLTNHYYLYRVMEERGGDAPIANHYLRTGDAGSLVNIAGLGVLDVCESRDEAERFLAFLLTPESQSHFVEANAEFPVVEGVPSRDGLPSLGELAVPELELSELANLESAVRILQESGAL